VWFTTAIGRYIFLYLYWTSRSYIVAFFVRENEDAGEFWPYP
jgi:hypothetical protein